MAKGDGWSGDNIHRKIYEEHYGPIPFDENGKTYEIHHVDFDHNNNDLSNLVAITCKEHARIHAEQKLKTIKSFGFKSEVVKAWRAKEVAKGIHQFQLPENRAKADKLTSERMKRLAAEGKHPSHIKVECSVCGVGQLRQNLKKHKIKCERINGALK